jgi:hypothetical protein
MHARSWKPYNQLQSGIPPAKEYLAMPRRFGVIVLLLIAATFARADVFDRYLNPILANAAEQAGVKEIKKLTPELVSQHGKLIPGSGSALVIVKTNSGLNAKLQVQFARQRATKDSVAIALIDRYVTYKPGEDRAIQASGQTLLLFDKFLLDLHIGQVVPDSVGGDLKFIADGDLGYLEAVGTAKMYLVTKHLPGTDVQKTAKLVIGDVFEPKYFTGVYKLEDDGRRVAKLSLRVDDAGNVNGEYTSEQSGRSYEVFGKTGTPKHSIQFTVKFPQSEQVFNGWMFTKDGRVIAGVTKMQEREFGFHAVRVGE